MSKLITVTDQKYEPLFSAWIFERLGSSFDPAETRYVASILDVEGKPEVVACTALNRWTMGACEAHAASDGSKRQKIDRAYIWTTFDFAFNHAGKNCMTTFVSVDNVKSLAVQEVLGFKKVGLVEGYYGKGQDAYLFTITKQQWLDGKYGSLEAETQE